MNNSFSEIEENLSLSGLSFPNADIKRQHYLQAIKKIDNVLDSNIFISIRKLMKLKAYKRLYINKLAEL
jgi:hypothetical protein